MNEEWLNMPLQNIPLWHKDYFELKALEKVQMWKGHSDLSFSSWKQEIKFPCRRCLPYIRKKEILLLAKVGNWDQGKYVQISLIKKLLFSLSLPIYLLFCNCLSLFNQGYNHLGLATNLGLHYCMSLPCTWKNLYAFLPLNRVCQFNSQT